MLREVLLKDMRLSAVLIFIQASVMEDNSQRCCTFIAVLNFFQVSVIEDTSQRYGTFSCFKLHSGECYGSYLSKIWYITERIACINFQELGAF